MNQHEDQLSEAFQAHENLSPDPAAVYARVQELSQTYLWRRRGVQVAGGAVLGAGLIAGSFAVPGLLHQSGPAAVAVSVGIPAAAPAPAATKPSPTPSLTEQEKDWQAYFAAGYTYDDAVKLAKLWHKKDIGAVKAEAGRRLLAHQPLPFPPDPGNVAAARLAAQLEAFWDAGYDYDDAVKLAKLWHIADVSKAKALAGKKLLAGQSLPIKPTPGDHTPPPTAQSRALDAYFAAGYDWNDAVKLAKLWKIADPSDAKVAAGKRLLAGQSLPIKP